MKARKKWAAVFAAAAVVTVMAVPASAAAKYTYQPTKETRYYWQGGKWWVDYSVRYTYKNNRLKKAVYSSDGLVGKYTYYKNGRLKKIKYYSGGRDLVETQTYKDYDKKGNAKTVLVESDSISYTIKYKYKYNKKGLIAKQTAKYIYSKNYSEKLVTTYTYDARGFVKKIKEQGVTSGTATYTNTYYKGKYLKSSTSEGWRKTVWSGFKKMKNK